jgi:hypothetical protein
MIDQFRGRYAFLSNFFGGPVVYEGRLYPSVEHAYQAAKFPDEEREQFTSLSMSAGGAKKKGFGRGGPDWRLKTLKLMEDLVREKFQAPILRESLLATGNEELVEGNYWHDNFWGDCTCGREQCMEPGANHLGRILMLVRKELQS